VSWTSTAATKAYCEFPYLPRLASFDVLAGAINNGVSKLDWQTESRLALTIERRVVSENANQLGAKRQEFE
jgi:hypothetical protein